MTEMIQQLGVEGVLLLVMCVMWFITPSFVEIAVDETAGWMTRKDVTRTIRGVLFFCALFVCSFLLKFNLQEVLTGFGALGVIVGLFLKDTLSAGLANLYFLSKNSIQVGDEISQNGGEFYEVVDISLSNITCEKEDGEYLIKMPIAYLRSKGFFIKKRP